MAAPSLQPDRPATLRIAFPPDHASARAAAATVRGFFAEQGVPEKELFACELCVAEACNNAVDYARGPAKKEHAYVEAVCNSVGLELRVTDHTEGFDWPKRADVPVPHSERGRGLFIIRSLMDEVSYLRGSRENVLIMRKKHARPLAEPSEEHSPVSLEGAKAQLAECRRAISAMARELCFRSETLAAVFRCAGELVRAAPAEGFEQRLLTDMLHLTSADWYVLRLVSPDQQQLALAAVSDPELDAESLPMPTPGESSPALEMRVAATRTSVRFSAAECTDPNEPLCAAGDKANGVIYPLCFGDALLGTIAVGRRGGDFVFGEMHEEVVRTFAEFLAIQTAGLRHRDEDVRSKVFARELDIAREIQRSLLPVSLPQMPGFGLAGGWHCAQEVGGDFYDALALSEHTLLLIVADVMGKGVPAALFATHLRGLLRGLSVRFDDPALLLGRLNRVLYEELSAVSMFITAQVAFVDVQKRTVTAAGAGHCPLLYVSPAGEIEALATQGMPLGVLPNTVYQSVSVSLGRPGTVLLHTDGLTDVRNPAGETYGHARLMEWLRLNGGPGRSATELRGRLAAEMNRFRADAAMADDQAFLLLTEQVSETSRDTAAWFPRKARARRATPAPAVAAGTVTATP